MAKTYFETAIDALLEYELDRAKQYLGYAVEFGSSWEKNKAHELLRKINTGKRLDVIDFARSYEPTKHASCEISVSDLLSQKRYTDALKELRKRERSGDASPEDFYYLGRLHDDFGAGMPNDKSKARECYLKAWNRGFAKAGTYYACIDSCGKNDFTKEQKRRILEKAASLGDSDAKVLLAVEEFEKLYPSAEGEEQEHLEEKHTTTLVKILNQDEDCSCAKLSLSEFYLAFSPISEKRYYGFQTLQILKEHWDVNVASYATSVIACCYRDGLYVTQDLDEAKNYFREVLSFNREEGNEEAKEFLSGKWKEVPDENIEAWHTQKLLECLKKVRDVFYLCNRDWIAAESGEEIREAAESFNPDDVYKSVCAEISNAATFLETHLGIDDAESEIERKIRNELSRTKHALEDWKDVLMEHIPIFNEKTDWVKVATKIGGDALISYLNPVMGIMKSITNWVDISSEEKNRKQTIEALSKKVEKVDERLKEVEIDLTQSLADAFVVFQESFSAKEKSPKTSKRSSSSTVFCVECGAKNPKQAKFCCECGTKIHK